MIKVKTLQLFLVEYEVPESEYIQFMVSFNNGKDIVDRYEKDQTCIGEHIVHNSRAKHTRVQPRSGNSTSYGGSSNGGFESE